MINTEESWDPLPSFQRMNDSGELPEMYQSIVFQIHNFFRLLDPREFGLLIFALKCGFICQIDRSQWERR